MEESALVGELRGLLEELYAEAGEPMPELSDTDIANALRRPTRLSLDASGHEHKGKGDGGGQFTHTGGIDQHVSDLKTLQDASIHPDITHAHIDAVVGGLGKALTSEQAKAVAKGFGVSTTQTSKSGALNSVAKRIHGIKDSFTDHMTRTGSWKPKPGEVDKAIRDHAQSTPHVVAAMARAKELIQQHAADKKEQKPKETDALSSLPIGTLDTVDGFKVRRTGENEFRIETAQGVGGAIRGDATKIRDYIDRQKVAQKTYGKALPAALKRAEDWQEPSFMDREGTRKAEDAFRALPKNTPVVSLEESTYGRTGKIVRDEDGRNRVRLDGEDGYSSNHVEPLDPKVSWRVNEEDKSEKEEKPAQRMLFSRRGGPIRFAHAPVGGVTIQGKFYPGGEFIPGEALENATVEEKAALEDHGDESSAPPLGTPRHQADKRAGKLASNPDYIYARESSVPNVGEDLLNSARHRRNAWRGLESAEQQGNAEELVTRDNLLRNEPLNLLANVEPKNALSHLAAHLAMMKFPTRPEDPDRAKHRSPEQRKLHREQYYEAYKEIKAVAEKAAAEKSNPLDVLVMVRNAAHNRIKALREKDKYNPVANALVDLVKRVSVSPYGIGGRYSSTHAVSQFKDFLDKTKAAYGEEPNVELLDKIADHVKDVLEGESFNKTFGTVKGKENDIRPADLYVKHASRKGGPKVPGSDNEKKAADYLTTKLGMRGLQYGNSVTDDERKHHLKFASEAFTDLADILEIEPEMASLEGKLGIAFGARGKGNALAHYEPSTKIINLTRKGGVGSLAHEWGHAFDNAVLEKITGQPAPEVFLSQVSSHRKYLVRNPEGNWAPVDIQKHPATQAMTDLVRAMKPFRDRVGQYLHDHYPGMSQAKRNYWRSDVELFARSFERHIQKKLEASDRENTYLTGVKEHGLWPTDEEAKAQAPHFDKLFEPYKRKEKPKLEPEEVNEPSSPEPESAFFKGEKPSQRLLFSKGKSGGQWITIGAVLGQDGKKHGGSPVCIENGRITKGHPGLVGKKISALNEKTSPTKEHPDAPRLAELQSQQKMDPQNHKRAKEIDRLAKRIETSVHRTELNQSAGYARAVWGKKARKEGIDPRHLHQLAAEVLAHDQAFKADVTTALQDARKTAKTMGYGSLSHLSKAFTDGDSSAIKGFDTLVRTTANRHPGVFGGYGYTDREGANEVDPQEAADRLMDLLRAGNPEPMSEDEAYTQAFDHLMERRAVPSGMEQEEAVPFSLGGVASDHALFYQRLRQEVRELTRRIGPIRFAHAPKGGITIGGKEFTGGEFVPKEYVEQASPEERASLVVKQEGLFGEEETAKKAGKKSAKAPTTAVGKSVKEHAADLQTLSDASLHPDITPEHITGVVDSVGSQLSAMQAKELAKEMHISRHMANKEAALKAIKQTMLGRKGAWDRAGIPDAMSHKPDQTPPAHTVAALPEARKIIVGYLGSL